MSDIATSFLCSLRRAAITGLCAFAIAGCGSGDEQKEVPFPETESLTTEQSERVDEILRRVVELRGLEANPHLKKGTLGREALRQYTEDAYSLLNDDERDDLETITLAYRMLRMIGPEDDIEAIGKESFGGGVIGLYVPGDELMVIMGEGLTGSRSEESTIAHELTHALQDYTFDLKKFQKPAEDEDSSDFTEYATTLSCVIEGDAVLTQILYMNETYGLDWLLGEEEEEEDASDATLNIPPAMQRYLFFDYNECALFVTQVWREEGWEGVDRLYENPPETTEQILHFERYQHDEQPRRIAASDLRKLLGKPWQALDGNRFGEFDVYNYLVSAGLAEFAASQAAEGWGGGQIGLYSRESGDGAPRDVLVHISLGWDTLRDLNEFRLAFDTAIERLAYAERQGDESSSSWRSDGEYGHAFWNTTTFKVDLVFATDAEVARKVADSFRSAAVVAD